MVGIEVCITSMVLFTASTTPLTQAEQSLGCLNDAEILQKFKESQLHKQHNFSLTVLMVVLLQA